MAIREVYMAFEAVYGTAAASNYVFQRVNDFQPKNMAPLDKIRETSGTTIVLQRPRLKGRQFDFTVKTYGYFDMTVYWLALAFGAATVTTVDTSAKLHTFLAGGSALLSATLKWKQVSSAGILWFQATGCKIKSVKCNIQSNGTLMWEFSGHGKYATNISAPTPVTDTTAAYIQPIDMSEQTITHNAIAFVDPVKKFDITVDNGLAPDWSIPAATPSRDFSRLKLGDTVATASVDAFFDVYSGSMTQIEDTGNSAMSQIVFLGKDYTTVIGTGGSPKMTITIPKPYVDAVSQDNTPTDTEEKGTLDFGYDTTLASNISFALENVLANTIYTGS